MDILTSITTTLATLKTGFEIKKIVGNLDSEVQQGELRVEIRKLQESLIDVQNVLLNAEQEILANRRIIQEKDKNVEELEDLLKFKGNLVRKDGVYFESDDNENPKGDPYCSMCWETEHKAIHLNRFQNHFQCLKCKNNYGGTIRKPFTGYSQNSW